nr:conopeptide [Conus arenatus]
MKMWMTFSVCVVVVMAITVAGSTPLQEQGLSLDERHEPLCCPWQMYGCLAPESPWQSFLYICYNTASTNCPGSCCPEVLNCFQECTQPVSHCYDSCRFVIC